VIDHHPTAVHLEHYVIGALDAADAVALEEHVARCSVCADALAREARLEVAIREVARAPTPLRDRSERRSRIPLAMGGALAMLASAAALVLMVRPANKGAEQSLLDTGAGQPAIGRPAPRPDPAPGSEATHRCLDTEDLGRRIQTAHHRGLAVTYPIVDVPRYEYTAAEQLR